MDSASLEEGEGGSEDVGLLIITKKNSEIIDYYEIVVLDNYVSYPVIPYDIVFIPYGIASYDKTSYKTPSYSPEGVAVLSSFVLEWYCAVRYSTIQYKSLLFPGVSKYVSVGRSEYGRGERRGREWGGEAQILARYCIKERIMC
jgi:hypothetical protein